MTWHVLCLKPALYSTVKTPQAHAAVRTLVQVYTAVSQQPPVPELQVLQGVAIPASLGGWCPGHRVCCIVEWSAGSLTDLVVFGLYRSASSS